MGKNLDLALGLQIFYLDLEYCVRKKETEKIRFKNYIISLDHLKCYDSQKNN